jgi:hypothetical protein
VSRVRLQLSEKAGRQLAEMSELLGLTSIQLLEHMIDGAHLSSVRKMPEHVRKAIRETNAPEEN